jgi:hypothetical protein
MPQSRRQLALLAVLLVALAVVLVWRPWSATTGQALATSAPSTGLPGAPDRAVPVSGLRLSLLAARPAELGEVRRNPFRFQVRSAPESRVSRTVAPPVITAPAGPVGPPPPPPIPLKFIGVIDAPARIGRMAILSDSRGGVFYGKEGDTIEGRYRVLRISTETVELAYMDGRGRQTIRLSGQ